MLLPLWLAEEVLLEPDEELEVMAGAVAFEAEEGEADCLHVSVCCFATCTFELSVQNECTDRGCCAGGRIATLEGHVAKESSVLGAAVLIGVAGALLVALLDVDLIGWLVVSAPAFLVLQDCVGEFANTFIVAQAEGVVDVRA